MDRDGRAARCRSSGGVPPSTSLRLRAEERLCKGGEASRLQQRPDSSLRPARNLGDPAQAAVQGRHDLFAQADGVPARPCPLGRLCMLGRALHAGAQGVHPGPDPCASHANAIAQVIKAVCTEGHS